jgi:hypothetical protein
VGLPWSRGLLVAGMTACAALALWVAAVGLRSKHCLGGEFDGVARMPSRGITEEGTRYGNIPAIRSPRRRRPAGDGPGERVSNLSCGGPSRRPAPRSAVIGDAVQVLDHDRGHASA